MTIAAKCLAIGCSRLTKKPGGFCWQHWDMGQPSTTAPTEQTEAQDDKEVTPLYSAIITYMCDEIESLRAQLEAARGERDALQRNATAWKSVAESRELEMHSLRADLAQKMQEHQDALSEMRGRMEGAERDAARYCKITALRKHDGDDPMDDEERAIFDAAIDALSPPSAEAV